MIDTLDFYTPSFQVSVKSLLKVYSGAIVQRTGETTDTGQLWSNGLKSTSGSKAEYRERGILISILPGKMGMPPMLRISMYPSLLLNGHNYFPVTFQEFTRSLDFVRKVFTKVGITTNIDNCKLGRIDIFKNIELNHDFKYYLPVVKLMSPKSMLQERAIIYDGYYRIGNKSVEYCCYNKLNQIDQKYKINPVDIGVKAPNVGRFEFRYRNHSVIKRRFGIETVGELIQSNSFSHLLDVYDNELKNNYFRLPDIANQVVPIETDEDLLHQIKAKYPKIALELFFTYKKMMSDKPFTIDDWASLMRSAGVSETTIKARRKQMMWVIKTGLELKQEPLQVSELLHEIYTELVN